MAQWKNHDNANGVPQWAPQRLKENNTTANKTALYQNTTPDATIPHQINGVYAINADEMPLSKGVAHTGWVLRTTGTGNRAGRVMHETLVAGGIASITSNSAFYPEILFTYTTNPVSSNGSISNNAVVSFTSVATSNPVGTTPQYLWQYSTDAGVTWKTTVGVAGFTQQQNSVIKVNANTILTNTQLRSSATAHNVPTVYSSAATFTTTA